MWGVIDESSDNPLAELWGLFKRDDDVSWQCLQWAIEHDERFGIWGGLSERERRRYKKEHKERA